MTDVSEMPGIDLLVLGELSAALLPAPPWTASQGLVYAEDGEPEPWDRMETLVAKFYGTDEQAATNSQFLSAVSNTVPVLIALLERSRAELAQARSDAARLAEAAEDAAKSGGIRVSVSENLLNAVAIWEQSLRDAGMNVAGSRVHRPAGVQVDRSEKRNV